MVDMGLSNVRVFVRFYKMIDIAISQNRKEINMELEQIYRIEKRSKWD